MAATVLRTSQGEFLQYTVSLVQGASAMFELVDDEGTSLLNNTQPKSSPNTWSRKWPDTGDVVRLRQDHVLGFLFISAKKYHYKVEKFNQAGTSLGGLFDKDIKPGAPPVTMTVKTK